MPDPIPKLLVSERLAIAVLTLGAAGCALLDIRSQGLGLTVTAGGMTPWAAFSVLLLGVSLALLQWRNTATGRRTIAVSAAVLMVLGNAGLGLREISATPVSLALMTGVMLITVFATEKRSHWRAAGLAITPLLMLLHGINLLGRQAGVALLADDGTAPASWITSSTLIVLNLALMLACGVRTWIYGNFLGETPGRDDFVPLLVRRQRQRTLLVFGLIVGVTFTTGYTYLRRHIKQMQQEVATQLTDVAELKVAQIEAWRRERTGDARTLAQIPLWMTNRPDLEAFLDKYRRTYGYQSVAVVDRTGAPVLTSPAGTEEPVPMLLMAEVAQVPEVLVEDVYLAADGSVRMGFIAPLRSPQGEFTGAIVLRTDANTHLYPILQSWPAPSDTAESILVRREGLSVVFLSHLRFHPNAAVILRYPLGQTNLAAGKAAIDRSVELSEGLDYRGEPVLWIARPISDSPWVMVAKVDQAEAYAALRAETWRMAGGFVLGLLAVGLLVGNYWRNRQRYYEQQHQDTERERQAAIERLALVMRHANDVILLFDEDMRVIEANERALAVYGRTPQEMRRLSAQDLRTEQTKGTVKRDFAQALTADGLTFETEHRHKDGTVFPVEVSSRGVEIEGRRLVLSIVRDITERRRLTEALARQEARFRFVFDHMPVGISLSSPAGIELVNPAHARITGVTAAASRDHGVYARATLPEDYARQQAAAEQFIKGAADHYTVEKRYRHPDGTLQWAELTSRMFIDPVSGDRKVVTTLIDLAQRKAQQQEIERLNRVYFVISQVNQALVRVKTRDELFREVCRVLVEIGRFRIAWVGWLNPETKLIDPVAVAGDEHDYVAGIRISSDAAVPEGRGPSGTAFREGRTNVCNDFFADPVTAPWRERAAHSGFQSTIAIPLRCEGRILGLLTVYAEEKNYFAPREIELLEETAGDVSFALDVFAGEDRRREAEAALAAREEVFSSIVGQALDAIALMDAGNGRFVEFNTAAHESLGYSREEFAALGIGDIQAEHSAEEIHANLSHILDSGGMAFETRHRHRSGELRDVRVSARRLNLRGRDYIAAVWSDITAHKRLAQELARQEARFRFIFEHAPVGISLVLGNGEVLVNEAHARITGVPVKDSSIPGIFARASHPDDYARQTAASQAYAHNKVDSYAIEKRYLHPDGRTVWARLSSHWFLDPASGRKQSLTIISDISEQKHQEEALRIREEIFSNIVGQAVDAIVLLDIANQRFVEFNRAAHENYGYTREEFANLGIAGLQAEFTAEQIKDTIGRIIRDGSGTFETKHRHRNGDLRDVRISARKLTLHGRDYLAAIWTDITAAKQIMRQLQAGEAKFRRLLAMVPLPIAHAGPDGRITFVNERFQQVFGYTPADVPTVQEWWLRAYPEAPYREVLAAKWEQAVRQAAAGNGEIEVMETNVTCRDGQVRTVQISGMLLGEEVLVAFVDITERVRNEMKLRQLSRTIEQAPLSVIMTDLSGTIEYVNPQFSVVSGFTPEEVLGRNPRMFKSGRTPPETYTEMWRMLGRGEVWRGELCNRKKNGERYYEQAVIVPVTDDTGVITHYVALKEDITERRKNEQALSESRDRLAKAEQIARLGNWTLEIATNRVTWSDEMYRLLELDPATTTPSAELYQSFMVPEDREVLNRRFAEALTKPQRFVLGSRLILRDGRIKYVEGTGEVVFAPEGTPVRAIGTVQDVTERKLVEIELHELVKGLRALRTISQALQQREQSREALLALVVRELPLAMVFPADARALIEIDGQARAAGAEGELLARLTAPITLNDRVAGAVTVGYVRPHAPADEGPFRVREREILDNIARTIGLGLGEREAFTAVQRFNTELEGKVAERTAELAARNQQIEALLNAIPDTVMRLRLDGSVLFSQRAQGSPRLAAITPLPAVPPAFQATADLLAACLRLGRQALAENSTVAGDIEVATPGGPVAIELRSAPTGAEEFVLFVRDITARKRLEAEVAAMLEKEREVSEMKTRFISVTSHEFRTPMAAAMGSVELLHNHFDRLTPAKREELFTRVFGSMHRMTEMLDDILTLNRMDANRLEVQPAVVELRSFVHSAIDEIRLGDREGHRFDLDCEGETAGFVTDPSLLHHILSNLLSNAVRYSPAGTVVTTRIAAAADRVRITVADQGIGIPAADRQRIFEPFERGSNVGQIKGTGLGLNIVKRMCGLLGGTIGVESVARGGSCFTLSFPRRPAPASLP